MVRRIGGIGAVVLLAACGGQDSAAPCVWRLDVLGPTTANINTDVHYRATLSTASGTCTGKQALAWETSNSDRISIVTSTDTSADVRVKARGTTIVRAYLVKLTDVRDSVTVVSSSPTDAP